MAHLAKSALGAVELGAGIAGVPVVAGVAVLLQHIIQTCDDIRIHKRKAKNIKNKCVQFINVLDEQSQELDPELRASIDEVRAVFERIYARLTRWSRMSAWSLIIKMSEIDQGLQECDSELQSALQIFNIVAQSISNRNQRVIREEMVSNHEEIRTILIQALTRRSETEQVVAMQRTGSQIAQQLMKAGQEQLRDELLISNTRPESLPREIAGPSRIQEALYQFHQETGTLPTIKVLDAEISKLSEMAIAGGTYSDIWLGLWLGRKKVALKGLRNIKADDYRAKVRIEREIKTWSSLENEHILPFYGVVTNMGTQIHMVSPWQDNGHVLEFLKKNPEADRLRLMKGAARGLAYLHSKMVVHGNVKCTNILVLDSGEACICDFGMSKLIEEVTEKSASATLTAAGSARWLAPELIDGSISSPTFATDVYSFAMTIVELLTGKYPFAERKRDAQVIHDVVVRKATPARPSGPSACTDELWSLLERCWQNSAASRPSMAEVTAKLEIME